MYFGVKKSKVKVTCQKKDCRRGSLHSCGCRLLVSSLPRTSTDLHTLLFGLQVHQSYKTDVDFVLVPLSLSCTVMCHNQFYIGFIGAKTLSTDSVVNVFYTSSWFVYFKVEMLSLCAHTNAACSMSASTQNQ